jgi:integrase
VRWSDIDLVGGFLTIPGERRKGGRQGRVYRLKPDAIQWLMRIREPGRELVWPLPFEYRHLWPRFKEILRCAGLPFGRERMFGCVRKSHASHLEAAGGDATASLGHSDRQTTVDYYLDEKITRADVSSWPADRLFGLGENPMRPAG